MPQDLIPVKLGSDTNTIENWSLAESCYVGLAMSGQPTSLPAESCYVGSALSGQPTRLPDTPTRDE